MLDEYTNSKLVTASWRFVDTVPQYTEEILTFSLMVLMLLTSFNDVTGLKDRNVKGN